MQQAHRLEGTSALLLETGGRRESDSHAGEALPGTVKKKRSRHLLAGVEGGWPRDSQPVRLGPRHQKHLAGGSQRGTLM